MNGQQKLPRPPRASGVGSRAAAPLGRLCSLVALVLPLSACVLDSGTTPTILRPILGTDTPTATPGTLEMQAGLALDPDDVASTMLGFMYGLGEREELAICFLPYDVMPGLGGDLQRGPGDTTLMYRNRVWEGGQGTSFAWQGALKAPTGNVRRGLGTGEWDSALAHVLTHEFADGRSMLTLYHEFAWLGDPSGGVDGQQIVALLAAHALPHHVGVYGELAQVYGGDLGSPRLLTLGVTQNVTPDLVFDIGATFATGDQAPQDVLHAGFTWVLGSVGGGGGWLGP